MRQALTSSERSLSTLSSCNFYANSLSLAVRWKSIYLSFNSCSKARYKFLRSAYLESKEEGILFLLKKKKSLQLETIVAHIVNCFDFLGLTVFLPLEHYRLFRHRPWFRMPSNSEVQSIVSDLSLCRLICQARSSSTRSVILDL